MKINTYQLQIELFEAIQAGTSHEDLMASLGKRKEELKHLLGGNPAHKEYRKLLDDACTSIRREVKEAEELGKFSQKSLQFRFDEIRLGGQILAALMELDPANITEADEIRKAYTELQGQVGQRQLRECDLLLDGAYTECVDALYGKPEVAGEGDGVSGE
jgi:hypothetical protein